MGVFAFNPLQDARWQAFVESHPNGSAFHTNAWVEALQRTYGYEPVVYTTTQPEMPLTNGVLFCKVRSWLSGSRLVSLPFSDHCQPLAEGRDLREILQWLKSTQGKEWKYVEVRPLHGDSLGCESEIGASETFSLQLLDLRPDITALFRKFHKSCVQRKIQRAEREGLRYDEGRSEEHLARFYDLLVLTRRRHGLPPQPRLWFRNVIDCLRDRVLVRNVSRGEQPVASMITMEYKKTQVYKYGCSDSRFNNLGGNALLFWHAIRDAKEKGMEVFDFGRSEMENSGLISFKENWGARSMPLNYYRLPARQPMHASTGWRARLAKSVFSMMPDALLTATGKLLYRHIG
jgi:CelD/BcsL family acetyltransferase involved in cellulose biosynthesis